MNLDRVFVADIECDGLLPELTKCHVLSCSYKDADGKWQIMSTNDKEKIQNLVGDPNKVIVGHNFVDYDKPALEKLGYEFNAQIIDTLGLSWYLYNEKFQHGLAEWGEVFGVPKPEIDDWKNLSYEEYKHRCEEDVKINTNLWVMMLDLLRKLYDGDEEKIVNVIKYFTFKMECLKYQNDNPILVDLKQAQKNLDALQEVITEKEDELKKIMPEIPKYVIRKKPSKPFKQNGDLSAAGKRWFDLLERAGLPEDYDGEVKEITKMIEPNPQSTSQMKDYLLSLGWKPKYHKDGANGKVPQLRDDDKNLCPNIKKLIDRVPELEALDGLSVAQHRAGYLKSFLDKSNEEGYAVARASGFTKTLRLKHTKPFVNLPKPTAQYGEYIRSVMVAPKGKVLIGSDVSSLEDKTKQIAIYDYDQEYVEQMNFPGWDAHLDIGQRAKLLTEAEVEFYRWFKKYEKAMEKGDEDTVAGLIEDLSRKELLNQYVGWGHDRLEEENTKISKKRAVAKTVNYAATYGAGATKISESAGISQNEARKVLKAYWDRNWSVKQYAEDRMVKTVNGKDWIYNPYSQLWLYLTSDHIKFSACNQNAGVKMFDLWVFFMIQEGIYPSAQFHDEVLICADKGEEVEIEKKLHRCMEKVNKCFNYPIKLEIDVKIGQSYANVH